MPDRRLHIIAHSPNPKTQPTPEHPSPLLIHIILPLTTSPHKISPNPPKQSNIHKNDVSDKLPPSKIQIHFQTLHYDEH